LDDSSPNVLGIGCHKLQGNPPTREGRLLVLAKICPLRPMEVQGHAFMEVSITLLLSTDTSSRSLRHAMSLNDAGCITIN